MNILYALLFYIMVVIAAMLGFIAVVVPAAVLFSYWFDGRWLVMTAILLDAYYGAFAHVPWFSIGSLLIYVVVTIVSPRLRSV